MLVTVYSIKANVLHILGRKVWSDDGCKKAHGSDGGSGVKGGSQVGSESNAGPTFFQHHTEAVFMDSLTQIVLAKHFGNIVKKMGKLKPGEYPVKGEVHLLIDGVVTKGPDTDRTPTEDIPLILTLALLLKRLTVHHRETAKAILVEVMTEALQGGAVANEGLTEYIADVEKAVAHVRKITEALPKKTVTGPTSVKVDVKEIAKARKKAMA